MRTILFIVIIIISVCPKLFAQPGYKLVRDTIVNSLTETDIEELVKIENLENQGQDSMQLVYEIDQKINDLLEKSDKEKKKSQKKKLKKQAEKLKEKTKPKKLKAYKYFDKALDQRFQFFNSKIQQYENSSAPDASKAQTLRFQAEDFYKKGNLAMKSISKKDDYNSLQNKIELSRIHKNDAIDKQLEAICYFINCMHLMTKYTEYKKQNKNVDIQKIKDEFALDENKKKLLEDKKRKNAQKDTVKVLNMNCNNLLFRIQIIATSKSISEKKLRAYFKKKDPYDMDHTNSDGLYRYWTGNFDSYISAQKYCSMLEIKDAFVIAFCDGSRIEIEKAIEIDKNKNN